MVKCVMDISATRYNKTINIIFAFCVSALILQVTYYILQFPFFVFSDDVEFVDFLLYRTNFPWCILPSSGRFFPFARLEYFPILVTDFSVSAKMQFMFALNAIKFSVFILVTYKILRQIIDQYLSAILVFVFMGICLCYGIFPMLLTTIYPEFTLVIILALFIFLYINALNSDSNCIHYSLMTILMCISLFFKETTFIIFLTISLFRLVLCRKNMQKNELCFHLSSFICTIFYLFLYYNIVYIHIVNAYASPENFWASFILFSTSIIKKHLLLIPAIILFFIRIFYIFFGKKSATIFDAFIFSSISYSLAFAVLKLDQRYYFIPPLLFIFVSIVAFSKDFLLKITGVFPSKHKKIILFLLCGCILCINTYYINVVSLVYYYKNTTQELISYIENSKKSGYDILFYIPDDISLKNTKDTSVTHWKFIVLKKIYALYSTNKKYEIKRIKDMDEVNKELNNSNMVIFADEIEIKQEPYNKLITLDYIFVNAVIKDNNDNIKKEYCDFIKKIKDKRLYNKDSKKLFTSAQNYCDSR